MHLEKHLTRRGVVDILVAPRSTGRAHAIRFCSLRLSGATLISFSPARTVDLFLSVPQLPTDVAAMAERAQTEDPEILRSILVYGMTRLAIFETLVAHDWAPSGGAPE